MQHHDAPQRLGLWRWSLRWLAVTAFAMGATLAACGDDSAGDPTPLPESPAASASSVPPTTPSSAPTAAPAASATAAPPGVPLIVYEARDAQSVTNVYTINHETGATTQLTQGTSFDGHPAWSPDRSQVIYVSDRDDTRSKHDVYIMNADGSGQRALTATRGLAEWAPKFSRDGTRITYVEVGPAESYLMLMNADGSNPERIAGPYRFAEFPAWTRDDREVWFAAIEPNGQSVDIFAVDVATREVRPVVATPGNDVCPHFSLDGTRMTYAAPPPGEPDNMELWAHTVGSTDTSGASDTRLTTSPGFDDYANPSPDGALMVFMSERDGGLTELYLMNPDGSEQRRLTTSPDLRENVPDW